MEITAIRMIAQHMVVITNGSWLWIVLDYIHQKVKTVADTKLVRLFILFEESALKVGICQQVENGKNYILR